MYPRHRWAVVIGSILLIFAIEAASDSLLDSELPFPLDTLLVGVTVAVVAIVAAWYAFHLIDRLSDNVHQRHQDLLHRNAALSAINAVSLAIAGQQNPEGTLDSIVQHARRLLRVDAAVLILDEPDGRLRLCAASAVPGALSEGEATRAGRAQDLSAFLAPGFRVDLEAPVGAGDVCEGTLAVAVADTTVREFSLTDSETLSALANEAGLALEAARLRDELKAVAAQRERERIAREMHDGLAQVLAYVNAKSQAVQELLASGRTAEAERQMLELASAARSSYVDVREAILSLSPPTLPELGLPGALEDYAGRFAESSKIAVRFEASPEARAVSIKPEVGAEILGVAREALTNVRKHAHANRVAVELKVEGQELLLRVADDGVGFDPVAVASRPEKLPHFGLAGMRQRAEGIGGTIRWVSSTGISGSTVELRVPVLSETGNGQISPPDPPGGAATHKVPRQMVHSTTPTPSEAD